MNIRTLLNGCFWNENAKTLYDRAGRQTHRSLEIYIPYNERVAGKLFVTAEEWAQTPPGELHGIWAVNLAFPPIVIKGEHDYEFQQGTSGQLATEQSLYMRNNPSAGTIVECTPMLFGGLNMRHIVLKGD